MNTTTNNTGLLIVRTAADFHAAPRCPDAVYGTEAIVAFMAEIDRRTAAGDVKAYLSRERCFA